MNEKKENLICTTQEELNELEAHLAKGEGIEKAKEHIEQIRKRVTIISQEEKGELDKESTALVCGDTSNFPGDIETVCMDCGATIFHTKANRSFIIKLCRSCARTRRGGR